MIDAARDWEAGADPQDICARIGLSDPSTLGALLAWWFECVSTERADPVTCPRVVAAAADTDSRKRLMDATGHAGHACPDGRSRMGDRGISKGTPSPSCVFCRCLFKRNISINFPFEVEATPNWMPAQWVGQRFESGWELHRAIDGLPMRAGRPPTTFAATFGMRLIGSAARGGDESVGAVEMARLLRIKHQDPFATVLVRYGARGARVSVDISAGFSRAKDDSFAYRVVLPANTHLPVSGAIVIGTAGFPAQERDPAGLGRSASVWASQLQKSIRRGPGCESALDEAISGLVRSKIAYRPELRFAACSGTRQLLWRLYICTIEDVAPYALSPDPRSFSGADDDRTGLPVSLAALGALALVAHADPGFMLPAPLLGRVRATAQALLASDASWDRAAHMKRAKPSKKLLALEEAASGTLAGAPRTRNLARCLIQAMPSMRGDLTLQMAALKPRVRPFGLHPAVRVAAQSPGRSGGGDSDNANKEARAAACDFHCYPWITLALQANLPMPPSPEETTVNLVKTIWNHSSSKNYRASRSSRPKAREAKVLKTLRLLQGGLVASRQAKGGRSGRAARVSLGAALTIPEAVAVAQFAPRPPTQFTRRAAFVSLFGARTTVPAPGLSSKKSGSSANLVAVVAGGDARSPVRIQNGVRKHVSDGPNPYRYLEGDELAAGVDRYLEYMAAGVSMNCPPAPEGFQWAWGSSPTFRARAERADGKIRFFAQGRSMDPYDAAPVMRADDAVPVVKMTGWLVGLVETAVYAQNAQPLPVALRDRPMIEALQAAADRMRDAWVPAARARHKGRVPTFVWFLSARRSRLSRTVWRDLLTKIETREGNYCDVAPVGRDGKRQTRLAVRYQTEGTMLRLLHALAVLYPTVIRASGRLRFRIDGTGAHFDHMKQTLTHLAFPPTAAAAKAATARLAPDMRPRIKTRLWKHQAETQKRVLEGVRIGKRGFADASTVGAGKTLSALACLAGLADKVLDEGKGALHGFLVLVPNTRLIAEWKDQVEKHTAGFKVVSQAPNGSLRPVGSKIDGRTLVVTTLARARETPFRRKWTMLVVDECTSIQNESALQTAEAWRQTISSEFGCLMLSATFFRARFSKLFFMIRMLQSPVPRTAAYLNALLAEHIICHVPKVRRSWQVAYVPVPLSDGLRAEYEAVRATSSYQDGKAVYARLKSLLHKQFPAHEALRDSADQLVRDGRRPLVFANSKSERLKVIEAWEARGGVPAAVRVVTVHEAAYGVNMQDECDCIVTRPQPGDVMEQMKGRIDRPGQEREDLILRVMYAENTVESVEAANVRLCGRFMKQFLDPLSEEFCNRALAAETDKFVKKWP